MQFNRGHHEEHFCEIILNLHQWFRCHLKTFSSRALATPVLSRAKLCNFGRSHHEEQFYEIILNLNQWFRRKCH